MSHSDEPSEQELFDRMRTDLVGAWESELADEDLRFRDPVRGATVLYFPQAIRAFLVGLDDIARQYLLGARECIDRALEGQLLPWLGFDPKIHRPYWDDEELDYHWTLAYQLRYDIECLADGAGDVADLDRATSHMEKLIEKTNGLSGPIETNRNRIGCTYLWLSIIQGTAGRAADFAEQRLGMKPRVKSITKYRGKKPYVQMLYAVARYANGDSLAEQAARASVKNLVIAHRTFSLASTVYWPNQTLAFEWAWLWEHVFRPNPNPRHAIGLLQGTVDFEN